MKDFYRRLATLAAQHKLAKNPPGFAKGKLVKGALETVADAAKAAEKAVPERPLTGLTPPRLASPEEINRAARSSGDLTYKELGKLYDELGITNYEPSPLIERGLAPQPAEEVERVTRLKIADQDTIAKAGEGGRDLLFQDKHPTLRLPSYEDAEARGAGSRATQGLAREIKKAEKAVENELPFSNRRLYDLSPEALNRLPEDVPQFYLPRAAPKETERLSGLGPEASRRLTRYTKQGGEESTGWYNLQQLRDHYRQIFGPTEGDERFRLWTLLNASTSMTNPIESNVRTASHYLNRALRGEPLPEPVKLLDPNTGRTVQTLAGAPPAPYGAKAQIQHAQRSREFLRGDMDPIDNPKPVSYSQNLIGNWKPITSDTHYIRDVVGPERYGIFGENSNLLPGEYSWLERFGQPVAKRLGLEPAQMQAGAWVGGGKDTGLKSEPVPYLQALEKRIAITAKMRGEPVDVTYEKFLRGDVDLYKKGGAVKRRGALGQVSEEEGSATTR